MEISYFLSFRSALEDIADMDYNYDDDSAKLKSCGEKYIMENEKNQRRNITYRQLSKEYGLPKSTIQRAVKALMSNRSIGKYGRPPVIDEGLAIDLKEWIVTLQSLNNVLTFEQIQKRIEKILENRNDFDFVNTETISKKLVKKFLKKYFVANTSSFILDSQANSLSEPVIQKFHSKLLELKQENVYMPSLTFNIGVTQYDKPLLANKDISQLDSDTAPIFTSSFQNISFSMLMCISQDGFSLAPQYCTSYVLDDNELIS